VSYGVHPLVSFQPNWVQVLKLLSIKTTKIINIKNKELYEKDNYYQLICLIAIVIRRM